MKKHPNSPHLSIKRLRELARKWSNQPKIKGTFGFHIVDSYIEFVESQRSSLISKHVKK